MDYCLSDGDGSATMWSAPLNADVDGNGALDAVGLDLDGDGTVDDALADLDGDGLADHAVLDGASYFTDDGSGTWAVSVDRGGGLRWFGLDGVESGSGPGTTVDLDGDGQATDRLLDVDGNGLADRALGDGVGYVDTDGDGAWDLRLTDNDGDGRSDAANQLS
ncbi:pullulanase [Mycolicibacterium moriokaense]|nr:pullulanase [Mycolicibacterium moriokaense]